MASEHNKRAKRPATRIDSREEHMAKILKGERVVEQAPIWAKLDMRLELVNQEEHFRILMHKEENAFREFIEETRANEKTMPSSGQTNYQCVMTWNYRMDYVHK